VVNADGVITFKHVGPLTPQAVNDPLMPAIEQARL
jgi:cytochrome c biogenesis protein CcmG/thiol:disulfide interchange protein DsbE